MKMAKLSLSKDKAQSKNTNKKAPEESMPSMSLGGALISIMLVVLLMCFVFIICRSMGFTGNAFGKQPSQIEETKGQDASNYNEEFVEKSNWFSDLFK